MSLTSNRRTHAALLVCAAACTASTKPDEVDIDFEFECGELDFYDLMALVAEDRLYEVACGTMPEWYPDLDLDWRELAAEYRDGGRRECRADPLDDDTWRTKVRTGCGKEAAVNLGIRAYRTAHCPTYIRRDPPEAYGLTLNNSDHYYLGQPGSLRFLSFTVDRACNYFEPVD